MATMTNKVIIRFFIVFIIILRRQFEPPDKDGPIALFLEFSDLKGYPKRRDYAAVRNQIGAIYGAFCMSVQNEG